MGQNHRSPRLDTDTTSHKAGWFLVAFGTVGLWYDLYFYHLITLPYGIIVGVGLWLLARSTGIIEPSESSIRVHEDYLRRTQLHAHHVHKTSSNHLTYKERYGLLRFLHYALLLIGTTALGAGLFTLYTLNSAIFYLVLSLFSLIVVAYGWLTDRMTWVTLGSSLMIMLSLWIINLDSTKSAYELRAFMVWSVIVLLFTVGIPAAWRRRLYEEQTLVKTTLAVTGSGYVALVGWVAGAVPLYSWSLALLSYALLTIAFALIAWVRHGRLSYAKHLAFLAALAIGIFAYAFLLPLTVTMIWFSLAGIALVAGFTLPSYSSRIVGLGALGLTILHYMLVIIPSSEQFTGPLWMQERIWFGIVLSAFLLLVNWWYQGLQLRRLEGLLQPVVRRGLILFAFAIPCVIALSVVTGIWQRILVFFLGLLGVYVSSRLRMGVLTVISVALSLLAVLQFFAFDAGTLSEGARLASFLAFAAVILFLSLAIEWYQKRLLRRSI